MTSGSNLDTGTDDLLATLGNGVLTLTLNRPDAYNAMTVAMVEALMAQLAWAGATDEVRCVVLTGAGRGFCSGGDVKAMEARGDASVGDGGYDAAVRRQRLAQRAIAGTLFTMPKPTIAAINGGAVGAGFSMALACDLRVMTSRAFLSTAFAKVGLSGDFGGTYFLSKLVGAAKARELYFLSDRVSAAEAQVLGLANIVCEPEALLDTTRALAVRLAAGPRVAFGYMKENLNRALAGGPLDECLDLEATHHLRSGQTEDHREAAQAFVAKREPVFVGR